MRVLVLGASGATGRLVVKQLIHKQINTRILIRESAMSKLLTIWLPRLAKKTNTLNG